MEDIKKTPVDARTQERIEQERFERRYGFRTVNSNAIKQLTDWQIEQDATITIVI